MSNHAKRRRRKLAEELGVSMRTAANIIKARAEERREERNREERAVETQDGPSDNPR